MDSGKNLKPCPFPRPIKVESTATSKKAIDDVGDSAWQAKESYPKLRLVRMPKSTQRRLRSSGNNSQKVKRISTQSPLPLQSMKKIDALEMQYLNEVRNTFKNNMDRIKADYEEKMKQLKARLDEKLRQSKQTKFCPICLKQLTVDSGFDPSACSIACWKVLLTRDGYLI